MIEHYFRAAFGLVCEGTSYALLPRWFLISIRSKGGAAYRKWDFDDISMMLYMQFLKEVSLRLVLWISDR